LLCTGTFDLIFITKTRNSTGLLYYLTLPLQALLAIFSRSTDAEATMVVSNGHVDEPTETSPLLVADVPKSIEASLDAINGTKASGGDGTAKHQTDRNGAILREDAGEVEDAGNPLFEGLPEVAARLNWLVPAVGIGVSIIIQDPDDKFK
jgi:hypothetical protein